MLKTNCFAYMSNGRTKDCIALKKLYCEKEKCKFHKTEKQFREDAEKAEKRLAEKMLKEG